MLIYSRCAIVILFTFLSFATQAKEKESIEFVFSERNQTQQLLNIEAALARAQAKVGIIPQWAATELTNKADAKYLTEEDLKKEFSIVRHRMVAFLNVWQRSIENGAHEYMHFGATTVDIYDTVLVIQLQQSLKLLIGYLRDNEQVMIELAQKHADTIMIGRTLGQHALPITFGKKVSSWLGENRRNIERLKQVHARIHRSGILKGAVGSYLGLGDKAMELEADFSKELGLSATPYVSDWHGTRDVFAEYSLILAMISKSYGRIGQELFLLQSTDIGETEEVRRKSAVGSSTMPHKKNPSKSEALMHYSRVIPRLSEVILDDMVNFFERDNTSRVNHVVAEISLNSEKMLASANALLTKLKVNNQTMLANVMKTNGLVMSQRLAFALAPLIGKTTANDKVHELASQALTANLALRDVFEQDDELAKLLNKQQLNEIFEPESYIGLAKEQTLAVIAYCQSQRKLDFLE